MFGEVRVYEIREVLRLWVRGETLRSIERLAVVDRKTARRYVAAAVEAGLDRDGGDAQLDDALLASVCERVRPHRPEGHGVAWALLVANHALLKGWLKDDPLAGRLALIRGGRQEAGRFGSGQTARPCRLRRVSHLASLGGPWFLLLMPVS